MLPPLIVVSGPSGCGKTTLIKAALARWPGRLHLAVSATTRPARPGEVDGRDYSFWPEERFQRAVREGKFLEWAQVHRRHHYGTPQAEVDVPRGEGKGVFLDVDVQGAARVRELYPDHLSVFVRLPALWWYCKRLEERGEPAANVVERLRTAVEELTHAGHYQHQIINDDLERAADALAGLVLSRFPGLGD